MEVLSMTEGPGMAEKIITAAVAPIASATKDIMLSEQGQALMKQLRHVFLEPLSVRRATAIQDVLDINQSRALSRAREAAEHEVAMAAIAIRPQSSEDLAPIEQDEFQAVLNELKGVVINELLENQRNGSQVLALALEKVDARGISVKTIDKDFIRVFGRVAGTSSNPETQDRWAEVLVREATEPGAVSPRLLSILAVMDNEDAKAFEALAPFLFKLERHDEGWNNTCSVEELLLVFSDGGNPIYQEQGIRFNKLRDLASLGLVTASDAESGSLILHVDTAFVKVRSDFGAVKLRLPKSNTNPPSFRLPCGTISLTRAGRELMSVVTRKTVKNSLQVVVDELTRLNRYYDAAVGVDGIKWEPERA